VFREDTASAKRRMERTLRASDLRTLPFEQRPYMDLATFFATAGDPRRARALLEQHDGAVPDSMTRRDGEPTRHAVLGTIALAERRYADAIRELWASDTTYDGPDGNCSICMLDDVGKAWEGAGVPDSAIFYWEKFLNTPYYRRLTMDATDRSPIVYRLGRLYESKGDATNAARRYREFVMLWSRADPPLQAKVTEARSRISRLADIERKPR
jgi:tetratricopeptide (TPR) repeat protein